MIKADNYKSQVFFRPKIRLGENSTIEKESFIQYVTNHLDARSKNIAREFGMNANGARYWLKRLGFSYKKIFAYVESK
ncbi:hypothetical protein [Holospora obtusa]|uniref:hypothetical protein n=1 Tax=Holospora obtusa TaxID=49893 RepID=UPI0003AEC1B2|nr:hypothetical protein [Holospora obtusa]